MKIIPQELATAASMTENGHRRDMHPAEQIAGFRAMAQEGKTSAQIGDLLGYSPRHVQRMLKLADLAPVILDALAEDRITTEHCQALALENDTARQVQVFEAACQSGWGGKPEVQTIRRLVTESEVAVAGNSKFRFVGTDAFSPDELRTDLFSDDGDGYVDRVALDAALLEKLQAVAEHLREAEGWGWCAGRMEAVGECREDAGTYRSLPQPEAVLTEAEEERLNELLTRYDALENQCEESDLLEAEMKLMRCMATVRAWTPEMRAGSGVVVSWRYGNVCVQRGVQLRSEFGGFFPVQVRFTPAHERFHLALCSPGDVSQVWVLVLVNAGGEPFAVVQVQRRFAPEAVSHSLALAASLDTQGYSVNDIIHILMAEGGQA